MRAFTQGARGEWGSWPPTCCLQEARPQTDTSPADRHTDMVLLLTFRTSGELLSEAVGDYGIAGWLYKRELLQLSASPSVLSHSRRLITSTEAILLKGSEFSHRRYLDTRNTREISDWKHKETLGGKKIDLSDSGCFVSEARILSCFTNGFQETEQSRSQRYRPSKCPHMSYACTVTVTMQGWSNQSLQMLCPCAHSQFTRLTKHLCGPSLVQYEQNQINWGGNQICCCRKARRMKYRNNTYMVSIRKAKLIIESLIIKSKRQVAS